MIYTTTFTVGGMACGTCVRHVTRAIDGMTGVVHVEVDPEGGTATVEHLADRVDTIALAAAIRDAGYSARVQGTVADDDTMSFPRNRSGSCHCGCCAAAQTSDGGGGNLRTSTIG